MQTKNVDGQVSLFGPDWPHGRMCLESIQAASRPARTFSRSSRRSSALKNRTLMLLDLRPGAGGLLGPYWEYDPAWLGPPGRLNTSECPKGAVDASLSQILLDTVPSRYYLSKRACLGILRRARERGKPLPPQLEQALKLQAGTADDGELDRSGVPRAFHINQREETIDLGDTAGALMATTNMQMQTFVTQQGHSRNCLNPWDTQQAHIFLPEGTAPTLAGADGGGGRNPGGLIYAAGFSANAGSRAGSTGFQEEVSPTLKGSQSGGMMPAVLCLNDQGGGVMDCSEDVAGTLRAQEHGHQPAVLFENHGIDGRYTGPHAVSPTLSARAGTGGNNLPLALQEAADHQQFYVRQRVDRFQQSEVGSTESARQGRDATDLVCRTVYQETVGALTSSDRKGPNSQYVGQDKLVVDGPLLIRRLVPQECELLQGFPPGWTDLPGASDSARYKALGNSVAVPCVEYLMQGIALVLRTEPQKEGSM